MAELARSGATPVRRRIVRIAALAALAFYMLGALALFFWPDGEAVRLLMIDLWYGAKGLGLPSWVSPEAFSTAANILAFLPAGFALAVLVPGVPWWGWGCVALGVSAGIELTQMWVLASRVPEAEDVLANGLGGVVGAWIGRGAGKRFGRTQGDVP